MLTGTVEEASATEDAVTVTVRVAGANGVDTHVTGRATLDLLDGGVHERAWA
ncbi:hypothetical protein ACIO13_36915 [Streptomyces sp. NPDC087425]|uniref:hypothetical protein n=1 Tax=Streptomyces sp. NPDC087425 TaxID=3365787 RepID=UPI00381137F0